MHSVLTVCARGRILFVQGFPAILAIVLQQLANNSAPVVAIAIPSCWTPSSLSHKLCSFPAAVTDTSKCGHPQWVAAYTLGERLSRTTSAATPC